MLSTLKLLLPAIIPSWRFFDRVAPSPRIEFTVLENNQDMPENWIEFRPRPNHVSLPTMLKQILWNPEWNETLFLVSCAERLIAAPTAHSEAEILRRIRDDVGPGGFVYVQFRLVFIRREGEGLIKEVNYISSVYDLDHGARP